ncbi:MAG: Rieske (2Fe-2S) protein [Candidatus Kariarchaeaceae archaeon]|jgi:nitrite reductase/ring-hydroxylating ferredoxin subunit
MTELVKVGNINEFADDRLSSFDVEGVELMGFKSGQEYIVTSRICTHKYFDLTKGHFSEGYVTCTLHTSTFDLNDGSALNPPAFESLQTYPTKVIDGEVFIDIDN